MFNGSTNLGQNDVHLARNIGYRASDETKPLGCFAYEADGTIRPMIEREYNQGAVGA